MPAMLLSLVCIAASLCAAPARADDLVTRQLKPNERLITILGTNDIHGAIETDANGKGGMALWAGIVNSIRAGLQRSHGNQATVVLLDGGDQYQGTLISSRSEGQTIIKEMRLMAYDGVVPGNHDYDFGPVDPPVVPGQKPVFNDQVFGPINRNVPTMDPRGVIRQRAQDLAPPLDPRNPPLQQNFFVSANTFLRAGLVDTLGRPVAIKDPQGCVPVNPAQVIDFTKSQQPNEGYILPFRILTNRAGLTIAVIGLDTHETPTTTDASNIADLCFADEATAYAAARARIDGFVRTGQIPKPDLFLLTTHNGDPATGASTFLLPLLQKLGSTVDAVIAGHTHQSNHQFLGNVHAIQSGANGQHFGRIDLIFDTAQGKVTAAQAANLIEFSTRACDPKAARYCQATASGLFYETVAVQPVTAIAQLTQLAHDALGTQPQQPEGVIQGIVKPDRIKDSGLGEVFTDAMRTAFPGSQVAITNNGGLRTPMPPTANASTKFPVMLTFDDLFRLLPFNNHVSRAKIPARVIVAALQQAATTCGEFPGLSFSGIVATYRRNCAPGNTQTDPQAVLLSAVLGTVGAPGSVNLMAPGAPDVDTIVPDFLAGGGDTYAMFEGQPWQDTGTVLREALAELGNEGNGLKSQIPWNKPIDHRWRNVNIQQDQ
jgi:5'-nucleotidase